MGVTVITDSTADMASDQARQHGIEVVPIWIVFGSERLRDGVDITRLNFYQRLAEEAPVERVVIGELVCSKRLPFYEDVLPEAIERLQRAGKHLAQFLRRQRVLQYQRALQIAVAVQAAGQAEMALQVRPRKAEQLHDGFCGRHHIRHYIIRLTGELLPDPASGRQDGTFA